MRPLGRSTSRVRCRRATRLAWRWRPPSMREVVLPKTLITASDVCIGKSQTLGAAGNLVLNGTSVVAGVAILDTARRIAITSDGDDSGITFTITGSNQTGQPINEIVSGVSAAAASSTLDFLNV